MMNGGVIGELIRVLGASVVTAVVTSAGWYVAVVDRMLTVDQARVLVATEAPYVQDRRHLLHTLQELNAVARRNQDIANDLRVEVARLNTAIEELQKRMGR